MLKNIAKRLFAVFGMTAIVVGLTSFQPAFADTTAHFSASWNAGAEANAEAKAVAIAGANATGKILLEEERTRSPHAVLRTLKPPTEAEMNKYGTPVYSLAQAQATLEREVKRYDKLLKTSKLRVAKLKAKIKFYKHNPKKVKQLKKQLKKAQKYLKQVRTSWKFKPLLKMHQGVCGRNTGRTGNMVLASFVDCIKASDGELWKGLGWVPELRQAVIVAVKRTNGNYEAGCHNFWFFNIPPGTPDESMVLVLRALAMAKLTVSVYVHVVGDFTLYGEMRQNGETCDTDSKTIHVDKLVAVPPVTVTDTDTDRALAFGQRQVQADASARAEVQKAIAAQLSMNIDEVLDLACDTPEEPEKPKTVIEIDELNDVDLTDPDCEGTRDECESYLVSTVHITVPDGASGTARISSNIGTVGFANGTPTNWRDDVKTLSLGPGQHDIKYRFNAPTEGSNATITLSFTPSAGSGAAPDPVSTTVRLNTPPTPPM